MGSFVLDLSNELNRRSTVKNWVFKDVASDFEALPKDIKDNVDRAAIQGGIRNMFSWRRGERIIKPEFGNTLLRFVHEPINDLNGKAIAKEIRYMFDRWEPRVNILKINVYAFPEDNMYQVEVFYTIPKLDNETLTFNYTIAR
ncbi:MAG TPA: GPW/gp25 family protein [Saccharofermentans sp.]|nr:GPW/gp25 family protein [Saccharofermentans sp.]